jgi:thioredoxin reductase (NADPH)
MYCARGGKNTLVLGNIYGSQQANGGLYENYPGFPDGILGIELSERMKSQAEKYGAEIKAEHVQKIVHLADSFKIKTEEWEYVAKAVILATGARHRKLNVPGEDRLVTKGLSYCVYCDGALFRNRSAIVVGYGNGGARALLYLANICSRVHLLCPKDKLMAEAVYIDRLKSMKNVTQTLGVEVVQLLGEEYLTGIEFQVGGVIRSLKADGVFVEMGVEPQVELAVDLGLEITSAGFVKVNRLNQETSIPGVYAAGDMTGGRMQAATAVGAGASAAISAMQYLG